MTAEPILERRGGGQGARNGIVTLLVLLLRFDSQRATSSTLGGLQRFILLGLLRDLGEESTTSSGGGVEGWVGLCTPIFSPQSWGIPGNALLSMACNSYCRLLEHSLRTSLHRLLDIGCRGDFSWFIGSCSRWIWRRRGLCGRVDLPHRRRF